MWRKRKKACPFFLLKNSRPLSPWGPLDSLSTCLGTDSQKYAENGILILELFFLVEIGIIGFYGISPSTLWGRDGAEYNVFKVIRRENHLLTELYN